MHEHAVQHTPRVRIQSEGYVADSQNRLHFGQLFLNAFQCLERFHACRPVLILTG